MAKVLVVGAGGVGGVVVHKCAQLPGVFGEIVLASRTESKCKAIAEQLNRPIKTAQVDADSVPELIALINAEKPALVINAALPYQNLTALLGSGFDPGVTNVYTAYLKKHHFDEIHSLDIIDCNAGDHGLPFATNFNSEINIREVTANGRYWENGTWVETAPLSVDRIFDFPEEIGSKTIYMMYHEELESLVKHFPEIKRARFWMTFSDNYLKHLEVLRNVGMTSIDPITFEGRKIVPLQFLKALLPDPASLGPFTKGKTCIGCIAQGVKDGELKAMFIYNV
ncbi:MAG: saccharopine dehydrogenase family protein, partial [Cellvibrio sp.]|nr:saccharopine dehydrogenase family protein [Cellvibrio sp.]